jgi:hypothetical protein
MGEEGIILSTDFIAEKAKFEIKDGKTVIDNKEFIVDRIQPIMLKEKRLGRVRFKPFYILKWDKIEAANIQVTEDEEYVEVGNNGNKTIGNILRTLNVVFPDEGEGQGKILPEMLRETIDLRFLKSMKKYAGEGTGGGRFKFGGFKRWMIIPVAFVISAAMMFVIQGFRFF